VTHQLQACAQRIGVGLGKAIGQMLAIVSKALWQKHFNRFSAQLASPVAKQLLGAAVDESNPPRVIADGDRFCYDLSKPRKASLRDTSAFVQL
jgi:hypothetical protein